MADVVTSQTIVDTVGTKTVMKFTNISDGSGETLVTKMDASALNFMTEDAERVLAKIYWSVNTTNGKSGVELLWAGTTNATAVSLSGQGFWDLRADGNEITNNATSPTGDVLLSTRNFATGDNYTILVVFR